MKKLSLFIILFCMVKIAIAQIAITGKVMNTKLEPLPFASVQIKNSKMGATTNENGEFELKLEKGVYELIVTMIGYQPNISKVVTDKNAYYNIILEDQQVNLSNVIVRTKYKDPAEEIVKRIIQRKDSVFNLHGAYSCKVYIKASQDDSARVTKKDVHADTTMHLTSLAEILLKLDFESFAKSKEEKIAVSVRGNSSHLFYLSTLGGQFELYQNLINASALSPTPFVSPISYSGILAYRYKTLKIDKAANNHRLYTIQVIPGTLSNATMSGIIIADIDDWVITFARLSFPKYHLPEYDFFEMEQNYDRVNNDAWMVTHQKFSYRSKGGKNLSEGSTDVAYKDFELKKNFPKGYFGVVKGLSTDSTYLHDSTFWNTVRSTPLSTKELRFIKIQDSVYDWMHSEKYLDSVDRSINKTNWKKLLYKGQNLSYHKKGEMYTLPAGLSLIDPFSFGGFRIQLPFIYTKKNHVNMNVYNFSSKISYGFLNRDINGNIDFSHKYNPFSQATYRVWASRNFMSFFQNDAIVNQLKRTNYYLDNSIGVSWGREVINGLKVTSTLSYALRRSLANYKTYNFWDSILSGSSEFGNNKPFAFQPYNALYASVEVNYTPFQPYIKEPKEKIILNSKFPRFYVIWKKGISGIFNSVINFDYLEFGIRQDVKLGLIGNSEYSIKSGSFLNTKRLELVDYKFQRRGDYYLFLNPREYFQSLDSTFPVFKRFYEAHFVHEFNGAIFNKIPLFKKLGFREVAGAGFLLYPERNIKYAEVFTGVERVFKMPFQMFQKIKIGAYLAGSVEDKAKLRFKIGITGWNSFSNKWQ